MSRRFKRASARKLQELSERRLKGYDLVALILDGKTLAEDEMVAAVGVAIRTVPLVRYHLSGWRKRTIARTISSPASNS